MLVGDGQSPGGGAPIDDCGRNVSQAAKDQPFASRKPGRADDVAGISWTSAVAGPCQNSSSSVPFWAPVYALLVPHCKFRTNLFI